MLSKLYKLCKSSIVHCEQGTWRRCWKIRRLLKMLKLKSGHFCLRYAGLLLLSDEIVKLLMLVILFGRAEY